MQQPPFGYLPQHIQCHWALCRLAIQERIDAQSAVTRDEHLQCLSILCECQVANALEHQDSCKPRIQHAEWAVSPGRAACHGQRPKQQPVTTCPEADPRRTSLSSTHAPLKTLSLGSLEMRMGPKGGGMNCTLRARGRTSSGGARLVTSSPTSLLLSRLYTTHCE